MFINPKESSLKFKILGVARTLNRSKTPQLPNKSWHVELQAEILHFTISMNFLGNRMLVKLSVLTVSFAEQLQFYCSVHGCNEKS